MHMLLLLTMGKDDVRAETLASEFVISETIGPVPSRTGEGKGGDPATVAGTGYSS